VQTSSPRTPYGPASSLNTVEPCNSAQTAQRYTKQSGAHRLHCSHPVNVSLSGRCIRRIIVYLICQVPFQKHYQASLPIVIQISRHRAPQRHGSGDGTVPFQSLAFPATWAGTPGTEVTSTELPGLDHRGMLGDEEVRGCGPDLRHATPCSLHGGFYLYFWLTYMPRCCICVLWRSLWRLTCSHALAVHIAGRANGVQAATMKEDEQLHSRCPLRPSHYEVAVFTIKAPCWLLNYT
jgi:hypothetical protein